MKPPLRLRDEEVASERPKIWRVSNKADRLIWKLGVEVSSEEVLAMEDALNV